MIGYILTAVAVGALLLNWSSKASEAVPVVHGFRAYIPGGVVPNVGSEYAGVLTKAPYKLADAIGVVQIKMRSDGITGVVVKALEGSAKDFVGKAVEVVVGQPTV